MMLRPLRTACLVISLLCTFSHAIGPSRNGDNRPDEKPDEFTVDDMSAAERARMMDNFIDHTFSKWQSFCKVCADVVDDRQVSDVSDYEQADDRIMYEVLYNGLVRKKYSLPMNAL